MDKKFGKRANDKVTGFEGIITAKAVYMYGCTQYLITPKVDKDGKKADGEWFDEGRIKILKKEMEPKSVEGEKPGCEFREHPNQ
jgi:hypothetical protein